MSATPYRATSGQEGAGGNLLNYAEWRASGPLVRHADTRYKPVMPDEISINQPTITAITDTPSVRIIYRNDAGATFCVNAVQKPNPIGFLAKLPSAKRPA